MYDRDFFAGDGEAMDRLWADLWAPPEYRPYDREQSPEALTMGGPLHPDATVEPDHLLRLWTQIDRCAEVAAECLAADLLRTSDMVAHIPSLKDAFSTELWVTLQDMVGLARLGEHEEWAA